MTPHGFDLQMKAQRLKQVDKERDIYLQVFANREANMTEQKGKKTVYVYPKLEDLFDYEKRIEEVENPQPKETQKEKKLKDLFRRANNL